MAVQIRRPAQLGAFIAAVRRAHGLSQDELARRLGVSRVWLGQVERGKASPRLDLVLRVLNELEITLAVSTENEAPLLGTAPAPPSSPIDIDAIADTGLPPKPAPQGRAPRRRGG
jgi:HTH-type transcriptional regulator/antitoxin HipB